MKLILAAFFIAICSYPNLYSQYEYIIQIKDKSLTQAFKQFLKEELPNTNSQSISQLWNIYLLQMPYSLSQNILEKMQKQDFFRALEENALISWRNTPNDPAFIQNRMWHHEKMNSAQAWDFTTGGITALGDTIVVAIIDAGCQLDHEDLIENIWINKNEIPNNGIDDDENGYIDDYYAWNFQSNTDSLPIDNHGTSIAGIIGAKGNNNLGTVGVNWNIKIMNLLAHYGNNNIREAQIVQAYEYIANMRILYNESNGEKGAFIVATNASFGIDRANANNYPIWCNIYNELGELGILNMAATNNNRIDVDYVGDMPTSCPSEYLIAVTESNNYDELNAAYGKNTIDLAAPSNVYTTRINNTYNNFGGTSGATPQVTGAIALMHSFPSQNLAIDYKENPKQIALAFKEVLLNSVDRTDKLKDKVKSNGRLNLGRAMEYLSYDYSIPNETSIIKVFPNPTNQDLYIVLNNATNTNETLRIYDYLGKEYTHLTRKITIPYSQLLQLNVQDLSNGLYILVWEVGSQREIIKFFKQ